MGVSSAHLGTTRQNTARTGKFNVEKSLNFVQGAFTSPGAHLLTIATDRHRVPARLPHLSQHHPSTLPWMRRKAPGTTEKAASAIAKRMHAGAL
jgi:hypothetical protein